MNILIADSGSTKTDWSLTDGQGNVVMTCKTQGINPIHMQDAEVLQILKSELILPESPQEVYFYGSGVTEAMKPRMASLLQQAFPGAKVEAEGEKHENGTDELNEAMALYRVVLGNFNDFYEKNLLPYIEYVKASAEDISQLESGVKAWDLSLGEDVPAVGFVGSIAHYFESPLRNVMCDEHHLTIKKVMQAPMPGLIQYHSQPQKQV